MSETGYQRPWKIYTSPNQIPAAVEANGDVNNAAWKAFGSSSGSASSSMNAVSFGFVATALLISMFLIMAILEHLFRPKDNGGHGNNNHNSGHSLSYDQNLNRVGDSIESGPSAKLQNHQLNVMGSSASGFSVLMPGEKFPTCIAQPAPLPSCSREGVNWPSHEKQ